MYLTIPNFESLTSQQIIDMSIAHVTKNGRPSVRINTCCYAGIGCGAAPFLTKEGRAKADMQSQPSWVHLVAAGLVPEKHAQLIKALQKCHDEAEAVTEHDSPEHCNFMEAYRANLLRYGFSANP